MVISPKNKCIYSIEGVAPRESANSQCMLADNGHSSRLNLFTGVYHNEFFYLSVLLILTVLLAAPVWASDLNRVMGADAKGLQASQQAQQKIEQIDDKKQQLIARYRQVLWDQRLADKHQEQLVAQTASLQQALADLEAKRRGLRQTRMALTPLMAEMRSVLEEVITADLPFLKEERQLRMVALENSFQDPTLSAGDKMARLLDAYQVELSYGYSTETWQGSLDNGHLVTFLRVGRLGFYYLTPDQKQAAIWTTDAGWKALGADWIEPLSEAILVASGDRIPALLTLPKPGDINREYAL